jgi:hypothetical protein
MIDVQTGKKVAQMLRGAIELLQRSRTGRAVLSGLRATARSLGQTLHQLWLEVTGFTFVAIAAVGAVAGVREYAKYQASHAGVGRLVLAICFTATFAWFGLSSFWRVNKRLPKRR